MDYFYNKLDYSDIDSANKQFKKSSIGECRALITECNQRIDLEFVRESNKIEDIYFTANSDPIKQAITEIDNKILNAITIINKKNTEVDLLDEKTNSKILFAFPSLPSYKSDKNISNEEKKQLDNDFDKDTAILFQTKGNETQTVKLTNNHLTSLRVAIKTARVKKPLSHSLIIELNQNLFINTPQANMSGIGCYRYYEDVRINGASWRAVSGYHVGNEMDKLIDKFNNEWSSLHPIERATLLHIEFIRIHPFLDGNGRTARLLTSYALVQAGYPSVIIKSKNKSEYISALDKAISTGDASDMIGIVKDATTSRQTQYLNIIREVKSAKKKSDIEYIC